MVKKPYSAYTAEELALDDLFLRWVQHPDDEEVAAYWQTWLAKNSHCADTVEVATYLIQTASQPDALSLTPDETSSVWGRIRESLQTLEDVRPLQPDVRAVVGWWYFLRTVAAVFVLVLFAGWALWMQYGPNGTISTVQTSTSVPRTIHLPDGSVVQLHPNSQLRYDQRGFSHEWSDDSPRAVWLQGEADFSIAHQRDASSARLFRVHTPDLTIEAIGTTFRVRQYPDGTRVALTSGQVDLLLSQQKPIRLRPGDSVEVVAGIIKPLP